MYGISADVSGFGRVIGIFGPIAWILFVYGWRGKLIARKSNT